MNSTPACNRPLANISSSAASTFGSTRTMDTTSTCLAPAPLPSPSNGHNSKIPGFAVRGSLPNFHGLTAFIVLSQCRCALLPANGQRNRAPSAAGRIPHRPRRAFQPDHPLQYQPFKRAPWLGFNWRYDSGLVSGAVPCLARTATCSFSTSGRSRRWWLSQSVPTGDIALVNNVNGLPLTADQEFEAGLTCNGVAATPTAAFALHLPRDRSSGPLW